MKLLNILKESIVLTEKLKKKFKLFPNITKNKIIAKLYQTTHQKDHRNGDKKETNKILDKIANGEWKSGVNSLTIRKNIFINLEKIIKEFSEFSDLNEKVILFISKFKNPNHPNEDPTYIEYVLTAEKKTIIIGILKY